MTVEEEFDGVIPGTADLLLQVAEACGKRINARRVSWEELVAVAVGFYQVEGVALAMNAQLAIIEHHCIEADSAKLEAAQAEHVKVHDSSQAELLKFEGSDGHTNAENVDMARDRVKQVYAQFA